jgi:hypothetical protein
MKIQKTFTIEKEVWVKFNEIAKMKSINKSLLIENYLKDIIYLHENPSAFISYSYGGVRILKYQNPDNSIYSIKEKNKNQL